MIGFLAFVIGTASLFIVIVMWKQLLSNSRENRVSGNFRRRKRYPFLLVVLLAIFAFVQSAMVVNNPSRLAIPLLVLVIAVTIGIATLRSNSDGFRWPYSDWYRSCRRRCGDSHLAKDGYPWVILKRARVHGGTLARKKVSTHISTTRLIARIGTWKVGGQKKKRYYPNGSLE